MAGNHVLDIKLLDTHALVTKPGSRLSKPVSVKDLVGILSESAQGVLNYSRAETLRLPGNVYLTSYAGNNLNLCMYFAERPATLKHIGDTKENTYEVMMPNIVIHLVLKVSNNGMKHEVTGAYYYATPVERDNLPSVIPGRLPGIFHYLPFPNCYENYTMCFGRNNVFTLVEGGDLRIFNVYYDVIASSPFNNDLRLMNVKYEIRRNSDWFKKMASVYAEEKRFPYELVSF
jgi:hypothetical protein